MHEDDVARDGVVIIIQSLSRPLSPRVSPTQQTTSSTWRYSRDTRTAVQWIHGISTMSVLC